MKTNLVLTVRLDKSLGFTHFAHIDIYMNTTHSAYADTFVRAIDIAIHFCVTRQAVLSWIRQGKIKALKFGATYRIPTEEFDRIKGNGV